MGCFSMRGLGVDPEIEKILSTLDIKMEKKYKAF